MYVPKGMQKTCMYQIMHIPKQFNILTQFIQIFIYTNNMYQCVPQDDAYLMLWRLALWTPDKVHTSKSVGVWKVMCNVRAGKVMCQCEWVW